jgi:glycosyltransferase involved in cell wall biosynthesis
MRRPIIQVVTQREAGGAQRVALLLHRELRSRGLATELWFLYARTEIWATEPGVFCLSPMRPKVYQLPYLFMKLALRIRRAKPFALISHTHYANVVSLPLAWICGVGRRVAVHHNALATYPAIARWLEFCSKASGMHTRSVAVSDDVRRSMAESSGRYDDASTLRIYNGLAVAEVEASVEAIEVPCGAQDKVLLFNVGRLADQKNQIALVEVLAELPECFAVIAGRGPLESALLHRAEELGVGDRLVLLGEIGSKTVSAWMARSDVFVFPSTFEAMPMALLEAMRAGMPIVASDIAAHRELVADAAILTTTEPASLAAAIRRAQLQLPLGNPLGREARQRSLRFTVQAMADAYLEAL